MPKSKVRKKRTTKAKITKTKRDKLIEKYCSWVNEKDFPMNFRNNFPTDINEINKYLLALEDAPEKYATSFEVEADKKLFQSYRYGYAVGFSEGVSQVLGKIKEVRSSTIAEEDEIANQISTNKVFDYLEKENEKDPDQMISKEEILQKSKLTREDLEKAGIQNVERYLTHNEPEINLEFNDWWNKTHGEGEEENFHTKKFTFHDLDKYKYISYGADLGVKFSKFSDFIKQYCWSRKRIGFWHTDELGNHTFHFDVKDKAELDEETREYRIQKAKELLEEEGIIEPVPPPATEEPKP